MPNTILNMSAEAIDRLTTRAAANKTSKFPMLDALAAELQQPKKPTPPARPAPVPARAAAPAARPAPPPAPAGAMPTAASIAAAILDETARRAAAALVKSRAEFTAMTPRQQSDFCRNGGRITV